MIFVNNLSLEARQELEGLTQNALGRVAQRAWMVLWSADQISVPEIARRFHCKQKTVRKWLRRYQQSSAVGLSDLLRCGRTSKLTAGAEQAIFTQINQPPWTFGYVFAFWSVASLAQHLASRCWQRASPWLVRRIPVVTPNSGVSSRASTAQVPPGD